MRLVDALFNKETGISQAEVEHLGKHFFAIAKCHPDDMPEVSKFAGCGYAETRAIIKALKWERKKKMQECEVIRKFVKAVGQYKNFNSEDPSAKAMYRQLNRRIKEVDAITDEINKEMQNLQTAIAQRDVVKRAIKRRRGQRAEAIKLEGGKLE